MDSELGVEDFEWVLKFRCGDDQVIWVSDVPLWEAITMVMGIIHILGLSPAEVPTFVKAHYEMYVAVWWQETTYYEGTLGDLARIALQELTDEQGSTPAQGRGTW